MAGADKLSDTRSLLQAAFDVADQAITVTGTVTTTAPVGAATEAKQDDQILLETDIKTAVESIDAKITAVNTGAVVVSSSALPTGASTAANQATEIASLASIDGKITAVDTGAVVVSSSALPTGAATSANQTTANNSLASIDGKMAALGQAAMAASMPVAIANNQSAIPVTQSGSWSVTPITYSVVDLLDGGIIQGSTIAGSGGSFKEVVASTAAAVKKIQIFDTTGDYLGWYTGTGGSEALLFITGPGTNETLEVSIGAGVRISVKGLEASVSGAGAIAANLLG